MEQAGGRLVGQFLSAQLMEQCIAAGFDAVETLDTSTTPMDAIEITDIKRGTTVTTAYTPSVTVVDSVVNKKLVTVRITWESSAGLGSTEYQSFVARNG